MRSRRARLDLTENFHHEHFIDPTNCPWVSEDGFNHGREFVCEMNAVWCEIFSKYLILVFFISESEKVIANRATYLLVPVMICQITYCKRAASRRREAVRRQPNRAVRESYKAEKNLESSL